MAEAKTTTKTSTKKTPTKKPAASKATTKKPETKKAPARKVVNQPAGGKDSFAVFATGGKQYRVSPGKSLKIEKITGDYKEGDKLVFDKVLMVDDGKENVTLGTPFIKGASVNATLKKIARYKTVEVIKYKQKSRYFKRYGHRQPYFEVTIDSIK